MRCARAAGFDLETVASFLLHGKNDGLPVDGAITMMTDRGFSMAPERRMLSDQLLFTGGRPSGFDFMRIGLSIAVLATHTVISSYGQAVEAELWASPAGSLLRAIVPMFFILSGFLVAGSLERSKTLLMFMSLRAIRIYPALIVEVLISAIIIGPLITTEPFLNYIMDDKFLRYLVNATGHISYELPGVFTDNPLPKIVNLQLWTVPYELYCYILLGLCAVAGIRRWKIISLMAIVGFSCVHLLARLYAHDWQYTPVLVNIPPPLLVAYFMGGVAAYLYRDAIVFNRFLFFLCAIVSIVLLNNVPLGEYIAIPALCYVTVYLGLCNPRRNILVRFADYSYGIFLYGFVVQQLMMYLIPELRHWWANFLVCLPISVALAAASWHLVEKPAMRLRPFIARFEDNWLRAHGALGRWLKYRRMTMFGTRRPPARE